MFPNFKPNQYKSIIYESHTLWLTVVYLFPTIVILNFIYNFSPLSLKSHPEYVFSSLERTGSVLGTFPIFTLNRLDDSKLGYEKVATLITESHLSTQNRE